MSEDARHHHTGSPGLYFSNHDQTHSSLSPKSLSAEQLKATLPPFSSMMHASPGPTHYQCDKEAAMLESQHHSQNMPLHLQQQQQQPFSPSADAVAVATSVSGKHFYRSAIRSSDLPNPLPVPPYSQELLAARDSGKATDYRSMIIRETVKYFLKMKYWWTSEDYDAMAQMVAREFPDLRDQNVSPGQPDYAHIRAHLSQTARNLRRVAKNQQQRKLIGRSEANFTANSMEAEQEIMSLSAAAHSLKQDVSSNRTALPSVAHILSKQYLTPSSVSYPINTAGILPQMMSANSILASSTYQKYLHSSLLAMSPEGMSSLSHKLMSQLATGTYPSVQQYGHNSAFPSHVKMEPESDPREYGAAPSYSPSNKMDADRGDSQQQDRQVLSPVSSVGSSVKDRDINDCEDLPIHFASAPDVHSENTENERHLSPIAHHLHNFNQFRGHSDSISKETFQASNSENEDGIKSSPSGLPDDSELPNPLPIPKYSERVLTANEMGMTKEMRSTIIRETTTFFLNIKYRWSSSDYDRISSMVVSLFPALRDPVSSPGYAPTRRVRSDLSMCARNIRRRDVNKITTGFARKKSRAAALSFPYDPKVSTNIKTEPVFFQHSELGHKYWEHYPDSHGHTLDNTDLSYSLSEQRSLMSGNNLDSGQTNTDKNMADDSPRVQTYNESVQDSGRNCSGFYSSSRNDIRKEISAEMKNNDVNRIPSKQGQDERGDVTVDIVNDNSSSQYVHKAVNHVTKQQTFTQNQTNRDNVYSTGNPSSKRNNVSNSESQLQKDSHQVKTRDSYSLNDSKAEQTEPCRRGVNADTQRNMHINDKKNLYANNQGDSSSLSRFTERHLLKSQNTEKMRDREAAVGDVSTTRENACETQETKNYGQVTQENSAGVSVFPKPQSSSRNSFPDPLPVPSYSVEIWKQRQLGNVLEIKNQIIKETVSFYLQWKSTKWTPGDYSRIVKMILYQFPELRTVFQKTLKNLLFFTFKNLTSRRQPSRYWNRKHLKAQNRQKSSTMYNNSSEAAFTSSKLIAIDQTDFETNPQGSYEEENEKKSEYFADDKADTSSDSSLLNDVHDKNVHDYSRCSLTRQIELPNPLPVPKYSHLLLNSENHYTLKHNRLQIIRDTVKYFLLIKYWWSSRDYERIAEMVVSQFPLLADPDSQYGFPTCKKVRQELSMCARNLRRRYVKWDQQSNNNKKFRRGRTSEDQDKEQDVNCSDNPNVMVNSEDNKECNRTSGDPVSSSNHLSENAGQSVGDVHRKVVTSADQYGDAAAESVPTPTIKLKKTYVNPDHGNLLQTQLSQLWKDRKYLDADLEVNGTKIQAHKLILLAMCPFLQSTLNQTDTKNRIEISMPENSTTEAVDAFLKYLYDGVIHINTDTVHALSKIADMMHIQKLYKYCQDFLEAWNRKQDHIKEEDLNLYRLSHHVPNNTDSVEHLHNSSQAETSFHHSTEDKHVHRSLSTNSDSGRHQYHHHHSSGQEFQVHLNGGATSSHQRDLTLKADRHEVHNMANSYLRRNSNHSETLSDEAVKQERLEHSGYSVTQSSASHS